MRDDGELLELARALGAGVSLEGGDDPDHQRKLVRQADKAAGKRLFEPDNSAPTASDGGSVRDLLISGIAIMPIRRPLNQERVIALAESIKTVGLISPIVVRYVGRSEADTDEELGAYTVVAGHHRLLALKSLGAVHCPCLIIHADDIESELIEIAENLHRSELSALERDVQIARWIELIAVKRDDESILRQPDAKLGRPESGVRAAARELGLSEAGARRSVKVVSLSPEAKAAAINAGLDDNRSVLLAAASQNSPERQVAKVKEWDTKRELELAKRAVARKQKSDCVSVEAVDECDRAADDLALFLVEHLPPHSHREAVDRLRAVSIQTANAFAELALPDVPLGLTVAGANVRAAA